MFSLNALQYFRFMFCMRVCNVWLSQYRNKQKQASEQIIQIRKRSNGRVNEKSHLMMVTHGQQTCVSSSVYLDVLTQKHKHTRIQADNYLHRRLSSTWMVEHGDWATSCNAATLSTCIIALWQLAFFRLLFYECLFPHSHYLNFNGLNEWPLV